MTVYAISGGDDSRGDSPRCVVDMAAILDLSNDGRSYTVSTMRSITDDGRLDTHGEHRIINERRCLILQFPSGRKYLASRTALSNYLRRQNLPQIAELEPPS